MSSELKNEILNIVTVGFQINQNNVTISQIFKDTKEIQPSSIFNKFVHDKWLNGNRPVSVEYTFWNTIKEKFEPSYVFLFRECYNKISLFNVILTHNVDLSFSKIHNELKFIAKAYAGIFKRLEHELRLKNEEFTPDEVHAHIGEHITLLSQFYSWELSEEKSLLKSKSDKQLAIAITYAVAFKVHFHQYQYYCNNCGKIFSMEEKSIESTCDCGGSLYYVPLDMLIEETSFILNEQISNYLKNVNITPIILKQLVSSALFSHNMLLAIDTIKPGTFSYSYPIPTKVKYLLPSTKDEISVFLKLFKYKQNKLLLLALVADTRFNLPGLPKVDSVNILFRTIESYLNEGCSLSEALKYTELEEWRVSSFVADDAIRNVQTFEKLL